MENNKIFEFKDQKYNLKVGFDDETKLLKVTMINISTNQETAINISGIIPQGATPDYVLLQTKIDSGIIEKLKELDLLTNHNGIFAKFNLGNMYKYDKEGVKAFLDYHTHKIEYEDKGTTIDEVKQDIRKYTEEILSSNEVKEFLDNINQDTNTENYLFIYSLVNKNHPQSSIIAYCDENEDKIFIISPYVKGIENKFEIIPEWRFSFNEEMMSYLSNNFEIIEVGKYSHYSIWQEMYDKYCEDKKEYDKGVQKYLKYCKKNKISKEYIMKTHNLKHFSDDIMKYYKEKKKERM